MMKFTAIILLTASLHVSARTEGQTVTLKEKNASLEKIFMEIRKQTGYNFLFQADNLKNAKKVSIDVENVPLNQALEICFKDQPFSFVIEGSTIIVNSETDKKKLETSISEVAVTDTIPRVLVTGRVMLDDSTNNVLENVNVVNLATKEGATTASNGVFTIMARKGDVLEFTYVGIVGRRVAISSTANVIAVKLGKNIKEEETVTVYNTGFQQISKERATGSFVQIDNKLLTRSISTNLMDRLKDITSGMLFFPTKNANPLDNIQIRGESTIASNKQPLVVLDNFEYDGNINEINPNDVESITILRDAGASSIWGAKAANGVIIITTKKGAYNEKLKVSAVSNVTVADRPDIYANPTMSIGDFIEIEKLLFEKGYYNSSINSNQRPPLSPIVEILHKKQSGQITDQEATTQINQLKQFDARNDYLKYLYRRSISQQYAINLNGGSSNNKYYFSVGLDKNLSNEIGDQLNRLTINANHTYSLLENKLEIRTGLNFSYVSNQNNGLLPSEIPNNSPYLRLADEDGNHLSVPQFRRDYLDTVGGNKLLDWNYRPLDEIYLSDKTSKSINYRADIGIKYSFTKELSVDASYRYGKGISELRSFYSQETYYARNYINQFSTINWNSGNVTRPVPLGGILDLANSTFISHNARAQINFNKNWGDLHSIYAIAGASVQDISTNGFNTRFYGYKDDNATTIPVDNLTAFRHYITNSVIRISDGKSVDGLADRFIYYFANASYTYNEKYTITGSARKDASNLFGVKTNQKWIPLWSAGVSWEISKERFFNINWIPLLKLRSTYGYNGNLTKNVTAYLVARISGSTNTYNAPFGQILSPPNPELRWERIGVWNFGLDYVLFDNKISGSIEYYKKNGLDLISTAPLAPSTGLSSYTGNVANIQTKGFDLRLRFRPLNKSVKWNASFFLSYTKDKITGYYNITPLTNKNHIQLPRIVGKPQSALYSYFWAGLDPANGDPMGYLAGNISKDYTSIINSNDESSIVYNGTTNPTYYGGLLNSFSWRSVSLSFNITYKLGYYFRLQTTQTNYASLVSSLGHKDYELRWQKAGDEEHTYVPSVIYPSNLNRDDFYRNSSVLVDRADHIRLRDIQISYEINRLRVRRLPFQSLRINLYVNGFSGILWRANDKDIDPDTGIYDANSKSYAVGLNVNF